MQSIKTRTNVVTRCKSSSFCGRFKLDIGIYDGKRKEYSLGLSSKEINAYTFTKIIIVSFGKKIDEIVYLMGYMKKKDNSNILEI